jgi:hypothetical protein
VLATGFSDEEALFICEWRRRVAKRDDLVELATIRGKNFEKNSGHYCICGTGRETDWGLFEDTGWIQSLNYAETIKNKWKQLGIQFLLCSRK